MKAFPPHSPVVTVQHAFSQRLLLAAATFAAASFVSATSLAESPQARVTGAGVIAEASLDQPCVLLRNGYVLFGSANKIGDTVCLTRQDKSKINLRVDQIETIGRSLIDLYEHRKRNRFEGDLKRYQADVRWSLRNGLVRQAASDVLHARSLDPTNPQTIQLLREVAGTLKRQSGQHESETLEMPEPAIRTVSHESSPANPVTDSKAADDDLGIGLSDQAVNEFTTKIQPILMNRCAGCHSRASEDGPVFKLHSSLTSKWAPTIVANENLSAVLQYIDFERPDRSLIRVKATDGHGGRRHTFGSPDSAMMGNLDRWLSELPAARMVSPWQQTLDESDAAATPLEPSPPPKLLPVANQVASTEGGSDIPELPEPIEPATPGWQTEDSAEQPLRKMRRMPKVANPFDPAIFNRRVHGR